MPRRRKLGIALGIVLAVTVVVSATGVGWLYLSFRGLGESLEHGFLGPPEQRRRIEVPDHRFAVSLPADWLVEMDPERAAIDDADIDPLLVAGPESGQPRCRVDLLPGGGSLQAEASLLAWAADHARTDEYGTSRAPGLPEDVLGITLRGLDETEIAAYWLPHEDDALIIACELERAVDRPLSDDGVDAVWDARAMSWFGMPALVRSIEPLPPPPASPTTAGHGLGQRVGTPSGLVLTFPGGWTIIEPDAADEEQPIPGFGDLLARRLVPLFAPLTVAPGVTAVRHAPYDDLTPVESCTVDALPGWLGNASPEGALALLVGQRLEDDDAPPVTYLDLPIGRVARLDVLDDTDLVSMYLWPSGGQLHQLVCRGPEGAVTGWDAIVASAEPHGR